MMNMDNSSAVLILRIRSTELLESGKIIWTTRIVDEGTSDDVYGSDYIHEKYRPAMLLFGLSLEAYVKALIIYQSKLGLQETMNGMPKQKSGHSLVDLITETGIELSGNETDVLERLTNSVLWMSKYHSPKDVSKRSGTDLARYDGDYYSFISVYEKVKALLPPSIRYDRQ
jgi:hypothetical protein